MTTVFSLVLLALAAGSARFEAADGAVRDTKTSLEWSQKDNGADVDFKGAKAFCDELTLAGHDDWRLPTIEELEGIYDENVASPPTYVYRGKPYPLRMDSSFALTAPGSGARRCATRTAAWPGASSSAPDASSPPRRRRPTTSARSASAAASCRRRSGARSYGIT